MVASDSEQLLVAAANLAARRRTSVERRRSSSANVPSSGDQGGSSPPSALPSDGGNRRPSWTAADAMPHVYRRHTDDDRIQTAAINSATSGLVRNLRMMRSRVGPRLPIGRPLIVLIWR